MACLGNFAVARHGLRLFGDRRVLKGHFPLRQPGVGQNRILGDRSWCKILHPDCRSVDQPHCVRPGACQAHWLLLIKSGKFHRIDERKLNEAFIGSRLDQEELIAIQYSDCIHQNEGTKLPTARSCTMSCV